MTISAREELERYQTDDLGLRDALQAAMNIVTSSGAIEKLEALHLNLYNPAKASTKLRASQYQTDNLQAITAENRIVVNEPFLQSLEAAIRSFAGSSTMLGSQYLRSDPDLFGLVARIDDDPSGYLDLVRRRTQRSSADPAVERNIRRELEMTFAFFLAHEIGHLLGGHPGAFGAFIDESAPLEKRLDVAVVKLCRHVEEFDAANFQLPGFLDLANPNSEVRSSAEELRQRHAVEYGREDLFFQYESDADAWADRIIIEHLAASASRDENDSGRDMFLLARGVFAAALYTWYRDLAAFGRKLGLESDFSSAFDITMGMIRKRDMYVHVASLFGEHHRFTFLRAVLHLKAVLEARAGFSSSPEDIGRMWCQHDDRAVQSDPVARREWQVAQVLQRYTLLCIHMDTAVKFANVGCASEFRRRGDVKRGSEQMVHLTYEPIERSVRRLKGERRPGDLQ